jgi:hypothetical protein
MPVYLLLKQHNVTRKYYLCKKTTNNIKSIFTYSGSGKRWLNHLRKHGKNISTVILEIAANNLELKKKAEFYNTVWNVGVNPQFMNLRPEEGDGGDTWSCMADPNERKKIVSRRLKEFNQTEEGRLIRKKVGLITKQNQLGFTMKERLGDSYVDSRKGKKFNEIYREGYMHPQQRPFKVTLIRTGEYWIFNNETEFKEKLNLNPDPTLRKLKKEGELVIKQVKINSKHNFIKNDMLIFKFVDL